MTRISCVTRHNLSRGQLPRPARSQSPGRRCDIKDLQLYQNQGTHAGPAGESMSQPSIHSLKRGAVAKSNTPGSLPEATGHEIASNPVIDAPTQYLGDPLSINTRTVTSAVNYPIRMRPIRLVIFIARPSVSLISIRTTQPRLQDFGVVERILALLHDACTIPEPVCLAQPKRHLAMCTG